MQDRLKKTSGIDNPKELIFCKRYTRKPFSTINLNDETVNKGLVVMEFDGNQFFPVVDGFLKGTSIKDYKIELIDYIRQMLDWKKKEERDVYEFCAKNMPARLTHKVTQAVIYGMFCNLGEHELFYEPEGFFYPYPESGDYSRKYYNPIYYPKSNSTLYFIEEGEKEIACACQKLGVSEPFDSLVKSNIIMGKKYFQEFDKCNEVVSFQQPKKWWSEDNDASMRILKYCTQHHFPIVEGEAEIEKVLWYKTDGYSGYPRNICKIQLKVNLPEYFHDNRRAASYKGKYEFEKQWEVDISDFLRDIDEKNTNSSYALHQYMYERARMLEGEHVKIIYYPLRIRTNDKKYYLDIMLWIPGISVVLEKKDGTRLSGVCPEKLSVSVNAKKIVV